MINIFISVDPTTLFLYDIINNLKERAIQFKLFEVHPDNSSYQESYKELARLNRQSKIIFLGHGQDNQLYGGESDNFPKKPFVKLNQMGIFRNQLLLLLACNSSSLLKSAFKIAEIKKCIGFGQLPTSMEEINRDKNFSNIGFTEPCIERFKNCLVKSVSEAIITMEIEGKDDFIQLKDHLNLILSKMINKSILKDNDPLLAELLFRMKTDLTLY